MCCHAWWCRDIPSNPRSPAKLIRNISDTIDTAMGQVDGIINKASHLVQRLGMPAAGGPVALNCPLDLG